MSEQKKRELLMKHGFIKETTPVRFGTERKRSVSKLKRRK